MLAKKASGMKQYDRRYLV